MSYRVQIHYGRKLIMGSEPEPEPVTAPDGELKVGNPCATGRPSYMAFDHEQLDVYRLGLEFLVLAERVIQALPKGRSHLADQLTRASISIVLNVAEGAGKFSKGDKRCTRIGDRVSGARRRLPTARVHI